MAEWRYMLDTNTCSYIIKGQSDSVNKRLLELPMSSLCISAITEAELRRGVAKKPLAKRLSVLVEEFLLRIDTLPWDKEVAHAYARLRTLCENEGKSLGAMDMLIAAHSYSVGTTLVTSDKAFYKIDALELVDWTLSDK